MKSIYRVFLSAFSMLLPVCGYADHPTAVFGLDHSGPITTISAETMPKGALAISLRAETLKVDAFSDTELRNFAAQGVEGAHSVNRLTSTSVALSYGLSDNFTVSIRQPYIKRTNIREGELEAGIPEAHAHGNSSGFGNISTFGQYRFYNKNNTQAAALLGVTLSTGQNNRTDVNGVRFETEFQPNSGATNYHAGLSLSQNHSRLSLHANVLFSITETGDAATKIGNAVFYNVAVVYPLATKAHTHAKQNTTMKHQHLKWALVLELNGESRRRDAVAGLSDTHSGGTQVYVSPGLRVSSDSNWSAFFSLGLPVVQNLNGIQAEVDYRLVAGISYGF